jgi:hypothetical protein
MTVRARIPEDAAAIVDVLRRAVLREEWAAGQ